MGAVRVNGSTSGYVELAAPAVAGSTVLTLPTGTGTLLKAEGGKVLQTLSVTKINSFSTSSTSFTDVTDLTLTITPSSASNKILVMSMLTLRNNLANYNTGARVIRGASTVVSGSSADYGDMVFSGDNRFGTSVYMILDSPATTSALTYKIQVRNEGGSTSAAQVNDLSGRLGTSSFTVIEVSA